MEGIQRSKLTFLFKANRSLDLGLTRPCTGLWDGLNEDAPQLLDAERGRLFALTGVWDDGVEGTRMSSSYRSDMQFQPEQE